MLACCVLKEGWAVGPYCTLMSTWRESSIAGLRRWRGPPTERVSMYSVPASEGWRSGADHHGVGVFLCCSGEADGVVGRHQARRCGMELSVSAGRCCSSGGGGKRTASG